MLKRKRKIDTPTPSLKICLLSSKKKVAKFSLTVPIKLGMSLFQRIQSKREGSDVMETSGNYKIKYRREESNIKMKKRYIRERVKEHE